jgi:L-ascorbate metabolism protein UlaG (beta-lactamase superfamily)
MLEVDGIKIEWLGHAGFRISNGKVIYIDPYKIDKREPADIILITHGHYDHCSIEDIQKITTSKTVILATPDCISVLAGRVEPKEIKLVKPDQYLEVLEVPIETVPAYNIGKMFHPKANEWVGYKIRIKDKLIYHAGDTDLTPEVNMDNLLIDIAMVPVSGTFVMTAEEAAELINRIKPKIVIPMHYGAGVVGTKDDALRFKKLVKESRVEIMD